MSAAAGTPLVARIRRILDPGEPSRAPSPAGLAMLAMAIALVCGGVRLAAQQANPMPGPHQKWGIGKEVTVEFVAGRFKDLPHSRVGARP